MTRTLSLLALLLLAALYSSCDRCPKDEKLGDLQLTDSARAFMPYSDNQTIVFENGSGQTRTFRVAGAGWDSNQMLVVDVPCSKGSFLNPKQQLIFYEAENYSLFMVSEEDNQYSLIYSVRIHPVDDLPGNDTLLIDYLEATAQFNNNVANAYQIVNHRGTAANNALLDGLENFRFVGDTTLRDRSFEMVHTNAQASATNAFVFYTPQQGIVGIATPNDLWVLQ